MEVDAPVQQVAVEQLTSEAAALEALAPVPQVTQEQLNIEAAALEGSVPVPQAADEQLTEEAAVLEIEVPVEQVADDEHFTSDTAAMELEVPGQQVVYEQLTSEAGDAPTQGPSGCRWEGCQMRVAKPGLCRRHEGGYRCTADGCLKQATLAGVCPEHGGASLCSFEGCMSPAANHERCASHGADFCKYKCCFQTDLLSNGCCNQHSESCRLEGCGEPAFRYAYCVNHQKCKLTGCKNRAASGGFCSEHPGGANALCSVPAAEPAEPRQLKGKPCAKEGCMKVPRKGYVFCQQHRTCQRGSCLKPALEDGFCEAHKGSKPCRHEECQKYAVAEGYCWIHRGFARPKEPGQDMGSRKRRRLEEPQDGALAGGSEPKSKLLCTVEGCLKRKQLKGLCAAHGGVRTCSVQGCTGRGRPYYCVAHGGSRTCDIPNCQGLALANGFCRAHKSEALKLRQSHEAAGTEARDEGVVAAQQAAAGQESEPEEEYMDPLDEDDGELVLPESEGDLTEESSKESEDSEDSDVDVEKSGPEEGENDEDVQIEESEQEEEPDQVQLEENREVFFEAEPLAEESEEEEEEGRAGEALEERRFLSEGSEEAWEGDGEYSSESEWEFVELEVGIPQMWKALMKMQIPGEEARRRAQQGAEPQEEEEGHEVELKDRVPEQQDAEVVGPGHEGPLGGPSVTRERVEGAGAGDTEIQEAAERTEAGGALLVVEGTGGVASTEQVAGANGQEADTQAPAVAQDTLPAADADVTDAPPRSEVTEDEAGVTGAGEGSVADGETAAQVAGAVPDLVAVQSARDTDSAGAVLEAAAASPTSFAPGGGGDGTSDPQGTAEMPDETGSEPYATEGGDTLTLAEAGIATGLGQENVTGIAHNGAETMGGKGDVSYGEEDKHELDLACENPPEPCLGSHYIGEDEEMVDVEELEEGAQFGQAVGQRGADEEAAIVDGATEGGVAGEEVDKAHMELVARGGLTGGAPDQVVAGDVSVGPAAPSKVETLNDAEIKDHDSLQALQEPDGDIERAEAQR